MTLLSGGVNNHFTLDGFSFLLLSGVPPIHLFEVAFTTLLLFGPGLLQLFQ